jgi:UDP-4-amino-4,6-dideoxy-N-acetyl-beta-L-altrosamine N-acetyltransferase
MLSEYQLRDITREDLEIVLFWRNAERIRKYMYHDHIIKIEEHIRWFERLQHDSSKVFKIFIYKGEPLGVVNFSQIDRKNEKCVWGFYIGHEHAPRGAGTILGYLGIEYAFHELKMRKICGEVLDFNKASIRFHQKLGFHEEGRLIKHINRNGVFVDVILFGLFQDEWESVKGNLLESLQR